MIYKGKCGKRWHLTEKCGSERYYECPKHYCRMSCGSACFQLKELLEACDYYNSDGSCYEK